MERLNNSSRDPGLVESCQGSEAISAVFKQIVLIKVYELSKSVTMFCFTLRSSGLQNNILRLYANVLQNETI